MKFSSDAKSQFNKLPSFLQYLKSLPQEDKDRSKVVKAIWFPNQFPNFSFDTESFRLRVSLGKAETQEFSESVKAAIEAEEVLSIRFNAAQGTEIEIETLEGELGKWIPIGEHGYRCEVQDKPKASIKRASKKPVPEE